MLLPRHPPVGAPPLPALPSVGVLHQSLAANRHRTIKLMYRDLCRSPRTRSSTTFTTMRFRSAHTLHPSLTLSVLIRREGSILFVCWSIDALILCAGRVTRPRRTRAPRRRPNTRCKGSDKLQLLPRIRGAKVVWLLPVGRQIRSPFC